jgi:hypothetical protein
MMIVVNIALFLSWTLVGVQVAAIADAFLRGRKGTCAKNMHHL